MKTIIHCNGYSVRELPGEEGEFGDWESVCWGDPSQHIMGRIPTAVYYAIEFDAALFIWSTGATSLKTGECEAEYAYRIALERAEQYTRDFPERFRNLIPDPKSFGEWLERISFVDCESVNTASSMKVVVPVLNKVLGSGGGTIFTVSSGNHVSRALRDALAVWQYGIVVEGGEWAIDNRSHDSIERRRVEPLKSAGLVTVGAIAAGTSYGKRNPSVTHVDDITD